MIIKLGFIAHTTNDALCPVEEVEPIVEEERDEVQPTPTPGPEQEEDENEEDESDLENTN